MSKDKYRQNPNTIIAPDMDELDILGKLIEKYYDGVTYDEHTKELSIPNKLIDEIMNE